MSSPARSKLRNESYIVELRPVVSVLTRHITYFNNFHCYCNKQHKTANTEQRGLQGNKRIKHTYRWLSWHDHLLQSQLQISLPPSLCPNSFPIYFSESPLLPIICLPLPFLQFLSITLPTIFSHCSGSRPLKVMSCNLKNESRREKTTFM